jgi:hypothetical protein
MSAPRFSALYADLKRTRPHTHPVWQHNAKLDARRFATTLGIRVPPLLGIVRDPRNLTERTAPVVVKPNDGCVALGVLPAVPDGGGWRDLFSGRTASWAAWMQELYELSQQPPRFRPHPDNVRGPWVMEGMVGDGSALPDDWKFYVIGGRVLLTGQFRRIPSAGRKAKARICQWTRDWERVTGGAKADQDNDLTLPPPKHGAQLVAIAERIAAALPTPFVRVDLYEDDAGPVFSEITPEPGGSHRFRPEWDERLGAAWAEVGP